MQTAVYRMPRPARQPAVGRRHRGAYRRSGAAYLPGHGRRGPARRGLAGLPGRAGPRSHRRCRPAGRPDGADDDLADRDLRRRARPHRATGALLHPGSAPVLGTRRQCPRARATMSTSTRPSPSLLSHVVAVPAGQAAQAMARLRRPASARDADLALQDLRAAWADLDGHPRQPAVAALSARLLRPGPPSRPMLPPSASYAPGTISRTGWASR